MQDLSFGQRGQGLLVTPNIQGVSGCCILSSAMIPEFVESCTQLALVEELIVEEVIKRCSESQEVFTRLL
ncbi:MAG: hypothetical protein D3917_05815 [Candidatus Electrothrix sp. AX5]|nr:hypothetical protein [Candidatus Electrothrix sp. AX5]